MPGRANDLILIPASFWQRPETIAALRSRRMGQFFELVHQHTGASQTRIGIHGLHFDPGQDQRCRARRFQEIEDLEVYERIADGLKMPDSARIILGLLPARRLHHRGHPRLSRDGIADPAPAANRVSGSV